MIRPPGPRNRYPLELARSLARDRLAFLDAMAERYGDVCYLRAAAQPVAILNHPELVRDVLVTRQRLFHKGIGLRRARLLLGDGLLTSEDDHHRRHRRMMQPSFHRDRVAGYGVTMTEQARRHAARWRDGEIVDAAAEMASLTMSIAGKTLFDAGLEGDARAIRTAVTDAFASFNVVLLPFGEYLARLPIPPAIRFRRARARLDRIVYGLIAQRRGASGDRGDLLSMLVAASDVEHDGAGLTDEELRDEVITILLAGFETVTNALAWTWYFLSEHPQVEAALHLELDAVLGGRDPDAGDLPRLTYTRAVIAESMRLRPPAYLVGRRALVPYDVPGTPYVLPPGTFVILSQHLLHRDARFWPDPLRFDADRWASEPAHRFAYFPFGAGSRICIGEHFAWMEATLILATIARRWQLRLVPGHPVATEALITLRPKHGMRMTCAPRGARAGDAVTSEAEPR
jgi:cytochrome P450